MQSAAGSKSDLNLDADVEAPVFHEAALAETGPQSGHAHAIQKLIRFEQAEFVAVVAALVAKVTLTHWQDSDGTEVYAVATAMLGAIVWLAFRWRAAREVRPAERAGAPAERPPERHLLIILYLIGLAVGDHRLTLLAGPAIIAFLYVEERRVSVGVAVVAAVWAALVGVGLGSDARLSLAGGGLVVVSIGASGAGVSGLGSRAACGAGVVKVGAG